MSVYVFKHSSFHGVQEVYLHVTTQQTHNKQAVHATTLNESLPSCGLCYLDTKCMDLIIAGLILDWYKLFSDVNINSSFSSIAEKHILLPITAKLWRYCTAITIKIDRGEWLLPTDQQETTSEEISYNEEKNVEPNIEL